MADLTVAIPVRNGGALFERTLDALQAQTLPHELLICDSGSTDGSVELARAAGARVLAIRQAQFGHGVTRNLLVSEARGTHVALLTQDAEPADEQWLAHLSRGFDLAADVGVVYGPYKPRVDASPAVRLELEQWFRSLSPDGSPRLDRLAPQERRLDAVELAGARGFLTDANACISRSAWSRVPFRNLAYAEDRALAIDMLRAGYAKVFMPEAAVVHSHDYGALEQVRRCFDEWRGLREVYGWKEPAGPRHLLMQLRGHLGQARRAMTAQGVPDWVVWRCLPGVARHHILRMTGAVLGSRADQMSPRLQRALSLERRSGFRLLDPTPANPPAAREDLRE